jgi:hypothetical protein
MNYEIQESWLHDDLLRKAIDEENRKTAYHIKKYLKFRKENATAEVEA